MSTSDTIKTLLGMAALSMAAAVVVTARPDLAPNHATETKQAIYRAAAQKHAILRDAHRLDALIVTAAIEPRSLEPATSTPEPTSAVSIESEIIPTNDRLPDPGVAGASTVSELAATPKFAAPAAATAPANDLVPAATVSSSEPVVVAAVESPVAQEPDTCASLSRKETKPAATPSRKKQAAAKKPIRSKRMQQSSARKLKHTKYFKGSFHSLFTGIVRS